jgi:hypothetical protein
MATLALGTHARRWFDGDHVVALPCKPRRIAPSARTDIEHRSRPCRSEANEPAAPADNGVRVC